MHVRRVQLQVWYHCLRSRYTPGFLGRPNLLHMDDQIAKLVLFGCGLDVDSTPALQHHNPRTSLHSRHDLKTPEFASAGIGQVSTYTCVFLETCSTLAAVAISLGFTSSTSSGLGSESTCLLVLCSCTGTAATRTCSPC